MRSSRKQWPRRGRRPSGSSQRSVRWVTCRGLWRLSDLRGSLWFLHMMHMPALRVQARVQPQTHAELIEYMLDTEGDEMTFEVARCRPLLTEEFFTYLKGQIGASSRVNLTKY